MSPDWGFTQRWGPVWLSALVRLAAGERTWISARRGGGCLWFGAGDKSSNNPLDLSLIPDQLEMRFPRSGRLMFSLLWKPSPGMMKGEHAWRLGQIRPDRRGPFYNEIPFDRGSELSIEGLIRLGHEQMRLEREINGVTLS